MSSKSLNTVQYYKVKRSHLHSNRFLYFSKPYLSAANEFYCFSCRNFKNTLELEHWTNKNQGFTQGTNRKQWGQQRNSEDLSPINVSSPICFHPKPRLKWHGRHFIRRAFWKYQNQERYLFTRTVHFCSNIWILSRHPVSLKVEMWLKTLQLLKFRHTCTHFSLWTEESCCPQLGQTLLVG